MKAQDPLLLRSMSVAPVFFTVEEDKPGPRWPLISDSSGHVCPVLLIECIICINEQEPPLLFLQGQLLKMFYAMNASCFQANTQLVNYWAGLFGFTAGCFIGPPKNLEKFYAHSTCGLDIGYYIYRYTSTPLKLSTIEWKKVLSNTSNISSCSSHP
jgi:hypothetical protein